ncbi:hypothetical protein PCA31118_03613 [Pandoraea captiosa]|uniref:Uncharacterized protein n=1 Tax=Pandoraea captiosa TaxID=2508302 RepID=A0A5E5ADV1_9BURK|nr:hypothetical protein [Pandoraea captiosa]VVE70705.1 hypothetical protein PCA31118_03613 [Pandoraea captiosa]
MCIDGHSLGLDASRRGIQHPPQPELRPASAAAPPDNRFAAQEMALDLSVARQAPAPDFTLAQTSAPPRSYWQTGEPMAHLPSPNVSTLRAQELSARVATQSMLSQNIQRPNAGHFKIRIARQLRQQHPLYDEAMIAHVSGASLSQIKHDRIGPIPQAIACIVHDMPRTKGEFIADYRRRILQTYPSLSAQERTYVQHSSLRCKISRVQSDNQYGPLLDIARRTPAHRRESTMAYARRLHALYPALSTNAIARLSGARLDILRADTDFVELPSKLKDILALAPADRFATKTQHAIYLLRWPELTARDIALLSHMKPSNVNTYVMPHRRRLHATLESPSPDVKKPPADPPVAPCANSTPPRTPPLTTARRNTPY